MNLECVEELHEYVVLALLASLDIWVTLRVVDLPHIVKSDDAASILVEDIESFFRDVSSEVVHLTADTPQEFLVVDAAASVPIEDSEETLSILVVS